MYSTNVDGKVLDFGYKKLTDGVYAFYLGTMYMGQLFRIRPRNWAATSNGQIPNNICPVDGFMSRHKAAEFLLNLNGYINNRDG